MKAKSEEKIKAELWKVGKYKRYLKRFEKNNNTKRKLNLPYSATLLKYYVCETKCSKIYSYSNNY